MKTATVVPINTKDECAICLLSEGIVEKRYYVCGCIVKAHSSCLDKWFHKPESKCIYCRKPTRALHLVKLRCPDPINPLIIRRLPPLPSAPPPPRLPPPRPRQPPLPSAPPPPPIPERVRPTQQTNTNSPKYTTTQIVVILFVQIIMITIITLCIVLI